ncbi:MAG: YihA family ribosome biogenesis GTP-binding protein [Desulfovibrionaceae bacterium]|nr:YihA family ribosome biogenesis GTP-binding protein [Desulfovibrionaceae bacterium]
MQFSLELSVTAYTEKQLLDNADAKVVLAGRSNVGKSSLLNALSGRTLAKISSTPGKTQSVNYYRVPDRSLYLIDLPGYGYAVAAREKRKAWGKLIETFFATVTGLKTICVLLDARLEPQKNDIRMVGFAQEKGFPVTGVLTKTDKCSRSMIAERVRAWSVLLKGDIFVTSAKNRTGLEELRAFILGFCTEEVLQPG